MSKQVQLGDDFSLQAEEFIEAKIGVIGQSGRGKTGFVRRSLEELYRLRLPFVAFDPSGILWGLKSSFDGKGPGLSVLVIGGEHADIPLQKNAGAEVARAIVEGNILGVVIDFSQESKNTYRLFVKDFSEAIFAINNVSRLLVIDEAPELVPQRLRPDQTATYDAVERLVRQGRNKGLGVMLVSQRAATISKDVLTQCGSLVVFGLVGTPDRKAIQEWVEASGTEEQLREFENGLASLGKREAWFWSPSEFERFRRFRVADFHTFHPDRTHLRRMGWLDLKPVTVDVTDVIQKLGAKMAQLRDEKAEIAEAPRLRHRLEVAEKQLAIAKGLANRPPVEKKVTDPEAVHRAAEMARQAIGKKLARQARWEGSFEKHLEQTLALFKGRPKQDLVSEETAGPVAPGVRIINYPRVRVDQPMTPPAGGETTEVPIKAGARRMVAELASRHPLKLSKAQLATLVGMTARGGTYTTYFSILKREGLISEDSNGSVSITEKGLDFIGAVPPAPSTHEEVMARWRQSLKAGCYRMLEQVVASGEKGIARDVLASYTDFTESGGTFTTYLSILKRNELVRADGYMVFPSEALFP